MSRTVFAAAARLSLGLAALCGLGCARSGGSVETAPAPRWVATQEQLAATGGRTVYEAIEALRPGVVRGTGRHGDGMSTPDVTVYVNGVQEPRGLDMLRRIPIHWVVSIRLIGTGEARFRVGRGGGLAVTTVDAPRQPNR